MSTHAVRIVRIVEVKPHPNADKLEIIPIPVGTGPDRVASGWQCVSQKGAFKPDDLAIYIEPDMVVPTDRPEFSWLAKEGDNGKHRLRAIRLRGALSFGLLIPFDAANAPPIYDMDTNLPTDWEGMDMMRVLGITRYEPPIQIQGAGALKGPWPVGAPTTDIESLANFPNVLQPGEMVVVTEKIHGTNARYLFKDGVFYMGSHRRWLDPEATHVWKVAAVRSQVSPTGEVDNGTKYGIEAWCRAHEGEVLYGEVYGPVQSLKYGETLPTFRAFAAFKEPGVWYMPTDTREYNVKTVPLVYAGPWDPERVLPLAETDSGVPTAPNGHIMEGIVIQAYPDRIDPNIGRVILKHISQKYWVSKHD